MSLSKTTIEVYINALIQTKPNDIKNFVESNEELSRKLICVYEDNCTDIDLTEHITNIKNKYITNDTKMQVIDDLFEKANKSEGGKRKVKKSRKRKSHLKSGKRPKRRGSKTRRIMYGGSGALDSFQSYSASSLNPGWAISGVNNFAGPTHVAIESRPSGMV